MAMTIATSIATTQLSIAIIIAPATQVAHLDVEIATQPFVTVTIMKPVRSILVAKNTLKTFTQLV